MSIRFVAASLCVISVSCGPRPVELGFWLERVSFSSPRIGGSLSTNDLKTIDAFDVRDRIGTLKPKLLLLRGLDDHGNPPEYEKEIHEAVPGSRYVKLAGVGHFPPTEAPERINPLIEEFVAAL